ncbi:MAG: hypothetical protein HY235_03170 [Acidobacteria bacterium]|nr:hypothetical protein [Acidobacteriota bacterium]
MDHRDRNTLLPPKRENLPDRAGQRMGDAAVVRKIALSQRHMSANPAKPRDLVPNCRPEVEIRKMEQREYWFGRQTLRLY